MERDIEKDLIEIECAIKSQREKDNIFTMSVLQRCHKLVSQLKEYKGLEEQGKLLKLPNDTVWFICDEKTKYATVMPKSIRDLRIYEIEGIDKEGYYWSTRDKALAALKKL